MNYEKAVKEAVNVFVKDWVVYVVATLIVFALGCLTLGFLFGPLTAGLGNMFLKAKSGKKKPVFDDLFIYNGKFFVMAVMGLLIFLGVFFGICLLVLPGLLLATLWMYAIYAMAYDNKGITESMKTSWDIVTKKGLWMHLVILLVIGIFNSIGGTIVIGTLVTFPITTGFLAMMYEENK